VRPPCNWLGMQGAVTPATAPWISAQD